MLCPCGTGRPYADCCGPVHDGARPAETAEALMRSRYAAFAQANGAYLEATRTGERRFGEAAQVSAWAKRVAWLGLTVKETRQGGSSDAEGWVRFVARSLDDGTLVELEEDSHFVRVDGAWRYDEAASAPNERRTKLGRNEPCPCGSGKKFKQCHA